MRLLFYQRLSNPSLACTKSRSCDGYAVFSCSLLALLFLHVVFVACGACCRTICCCKKSAVVNIFPHVKHECKCTPPSLLPGASRLPEGGAGRASNCSYLHQGKSTRISMHAHQHQSPALNRNTKKILSGATHGRCCGIVLIFFLPV